MSFFLACHEKLRRPTRLRPKAEDTSGETASFVIGWFEFAGGTGSLSFRIALWECFGDAISFYWLLRRCETNWVQISSPKNSHWGIRHNTTPYSCATTKWRMLVTINKFKSWCLALVSLATGFRVVTQSERCVMTLKTAVKDTSLTLDYFYLQPFAHIISVSRNSEAKWYHIQNSLCYFCAWISSLFNWSNSISGLFNKYKSWTTLHEGDFSTSEGIHVKIALPATKNVIVVYRLVLCCHGEQPSDVACKYLSLVTLCSDTFFKNVYCISCF